MRRHPLFTVPALILLLLCGLVARADHDAAHVNHEAGVYCKQVCALDPLPQGQTPVNRIRITLAVQRNEHPDRAPASDVDPAHPTRAPPASIV